MAWDIFGMGHIWSRDINGTGHIWQDINGMGHIWSIWDINGQDMFGHGKILEHDSLGHVWGTFKQSEGQTQPNGFRVNILYNRVGWECREFST